LGLSGLIDSEEDLGYWREDKSASKPLWDLLGRRKSILDHSNRFIHLSALDEGTCHLQESVSAVCRIRDGFRHIPCLFGQCYGITP